MKWLDHSSVLKRSRQDGEVVKDIAICEGSLGFDSRVGKIRFCVAHALNRTEGPRYSLHASAFHREYNENLVF